MSTPRDIVNKWLEEAAALGDVDSYSAKRTAKRYSCYWDMEMRVGHAAHRITVRDISDSGVGIISPVEVGAGRTIELRRTQEEPWIEARIMHATLTVGRYKLGALIQFEETVTRPRQPGETKQLAQSLIALARLKISRGDASAAEMLVRECLEIREKALGKDHWTTGIAQSVLGECLIVMGRYDGAEPLLLEAHPIIKEGLGEDDDRTRAALERIVQLYQAWGKPEKAEEYGAPA
ncbi:MAG: tetratricopeptide repeat protein [Phycisphaerae bacterium]